MNELTSTLTSTDNLVAILRANNDIQAAGHQMRDAFGDYPLALPNHFAVHDLEEYQLLRRRARGSMRTSVVGDFVQYAIKNDDGGAIFVDPDELSARAVLNLGSNEWPGHADNTASLQLELTPAYRALLSIQGAGILDQRNAVEWLEDWVDHINFFGEPTYQEGGDLLVSDAIKPGTALAAIRSMSIETARKVESEEKALGTALSAFESVQASSKHTLPQRIVFTCRPTDELGVRPFTVRVVVITSGDKPMLRFAIQRLATHQAEMGAELVNLITTAQAKAKASGDALAAPIYLGTYKRGE